MEYTAQFTYDCLWRVDGEKRVCTGGHESDGYPCIRKVLGKLNTKIYYTTYIKYRNAHNKLKRYARYSYYRDLLEKHRSDIRKTLNIMNSVIGRTVQYLTLL